MFFHHLRFFNDLAFKCTALQSNWCKWLTFKHFAGQDPTYSTLRFERHEFGATLAFFAGAGGSSSSWPRKGARNNGRNGVCPWWSSSLIKPGPSFPGATSWLFDASPQIVSGVVWVPSPWVLPFVSTVFRFVCDSSLSIPKLGIQIQCLPNYTMDKWQTSWYRTVLSTVWESWENSPSIFQSVRIPVFGNTVLVNTLVLIARTIAPSITLITKVVLQLECMPFASFHLTGFADGGKVNGSWWGQLVQGKLRNESFAFWMQESLPSDFAHLPACFLWLFLRESEGPTGTKVNIKKGVNYVPMTGMVSWIHTNESGLMTWSWKKHVALISNSLNLFIFNIHLDFLSLSLWNAEPQIQLNGRKSECSRLSFSNASLPVELLTTSAAEVFDGFFAPGLPVLCWVGLQLPKPMNQLESAPKSSKTFWQLVNSSHIGNLSQSLQYYASSLQYYASSRSCKYNSEYIHLSQICASLHMTRCTPGLCQLCHLLAMEPPQKKGCSPHGLQLQRQPLRWVCGIVGIKMWQSWSVASLGTISMYLHCLFCIPKWFKTDQKTPAKRFLGVEGMVTDWYTRRKRENAVEVGWGGHMYTVYILVTYADARHK